MLAELPILGYKTTKNCCAILLLFFAYLVLAGFPLLFAQARTQRQAAGQRKTCKLPGYPEERVAEVVAASDALPAPLSADAAIRIAIKISPHCPALAKELLQRAFDQADTVKGETEYRRTPGSYLTDSRLSYAANGSSLQTDRLSLQSRATLAMAPLDSKLAIRLFERIAAPRPLAAACSSAFVPDVSIYYELLGRILQLFQARKPQNEAEAQEAFVKMEEVVGATTSPVQLISVASLLEKQTITSAQLSTLLSGLAAAIDSFPVDNRSLAASGHWRSVTGTPADAVAKLVKMSRDHKVSSYSLVQAYRNYLERSLRGVQCQDDFPKGSASLVTTAKSLNESLAKLGPGIEPISVPESSPKFEPGPAEGKYWSTPKTEALLMDGKHLNFDDEWQAYTDEDRKTPEWQDRVRLMLNHMDDWRPSDEQYPTDYYHQRCMLFYGILPNLPPGALYDKVVSEWMATVEESSLQWDNPAEWYFEVTRFLRFSKKTDSAPTPQSVLDSLKNSSNDYLHAAGVLAEFLQ